MNSSGMNSMGAGLSGPYVEAMVRERHAAAEHGRLIKLAMCGGRRRKAAAAAEDWCDTGRTSSAASRHAC
jgi:hypothetical protein